MTRVVILLSTEAGHLSVYHESREAAVVFIQQWVQRQLKRIKDRDLLVETTLYYQDEYAVLGQYIIGMYIPDEPGEEWRN